MEPLTEIVELAIKFGMTDTTYGAAIQMRNALSSGGKLTAGV